MFGFNQLQLGIIGVLLLALLTLGTFAGCEHKRAEEQEELAARLGKARDAAVDANASLEVTNRDLSAAIEQWKKRATLADGVRQLAEEAAAFREQLAAERAARDAEARRIDDAKPDCVKLQDVNFEALCPALARGLRERAGGGGKDRHREGARTGPGETRQ